MPSPPNFSGLLSTFQASPLSLVTKGKKSRVATKIQALFRGHNTRRKVKALKKKKQTRLRRVSSQLDTSISQLKNLLAFPDRITRSSSRRNK